MSQAPSPWSKRPGQLYNIKDWKDEIGCNIKVVKRGDEFMLSVCWYLVFSVWNALQWVIDSSSISPQLFCLTLQCGWGELQFRVIVCTNPFTGNYNYSNCYLDKQYLVGIWDR